MGEVGVVLGCTNMGDASVMLAVCKTLMGVVELAVAWASL
jgi:hypothetical protein